MYIYVYISYYPGLFSHETGLFVHDAKMFPHETWLFLREIEPSDMNEGSSYTKKESFTNY